MMTKHILYLAGILMVALLVSSCGDDESCEQVQQNIESAQASAQTDVEEAQRLALAGDQQGAFARLDNVVATCRSMEEKYGTSYSCQMESGSEYKVKTECDDAERQVASLKETLSSQIARRDEGFRF